MMWRYLRQSIVGVIAGIVAAGVVIFLLNENFLNFSAVSDVSVSRLSWTEFACFISAPAILVAIFNRRALPLLRSFFVGLNWSDTLENYLKFVIPLSLLYLNPYGVSLYSHFSQLISLTMSVIFGASIIAQIQAWVINKRNDSIRKEAWFIEDKPFNDSHELSESQRKYVEELKEVLEIGQPRSVGLTGPWGSGKSMIYQQVRLTLKENEYLVWVDFESWRYASEEALVKGFYDSIAKALELQSPSYRNIVEVMTKAVNQFIGIANNRLLSSTFNVLTSVDSINKPDNIIKEILDREKKRLIIVVDDIERHFSKDRIYRTLQLVHHAKSIHEHNIQILCIYEKDAITRAAPSHAPDPAAFLEKFTEMEISILPPSDTELQDLLGEYIEEYRDLLKIDSTFSFSSYEGDVGEIGSYRGIIRIFNDLILTAHTNNGRQYSYEEYVCFEDRFAMAHIKLAYPVLYQDIYRNRDYYVERDGLDNLERHFMDKGQRRTLFEKHVTNIMQKAGLQDERRDIVIQMVCNLFPTLADGLGKTSKRSNVSSADLKSAKQVAHSDVLDAYFSATARVEEYNLSEHLVNQTLDRINKTEFEDEELVRIMSDFMMEAEDKKVTGVAFFLMQQAIGRHEGGLQTFRLPLLRAWLRAILRKDTKESDSAIGRILSKADELIRRESLVNSVEVDQLSSMLFMNIVRFIEDPKNALMMLLYMIPDRGNGFLTEYVQQEVGKNNGLFVRVLSKVTRLITERSLNIYKMYDYGDWAFVAYQWAYSISPGGGVNASIPGWKRRYRIAIEYLGDLLKKDDLLAYNVVMRRFKDKALDNAFESERMKVNSTTFSPLEVSFMVELTNKLRRSSHLTGDQKEEVGQIYKKLKLFNKDN